MTKDLAFGERAINRILKELEKPQELAHEFAKAILAQAVRNAASRPTPQAPMAAEALDVQGASIGSHSAGGSSVEVGIGSEFGSNRYLQFQKPPNPRGYWLYPAGESTEALAVADRALNDILEAAVRG